MKSINLFLLLFLLILGGCNNVNNAGQEEETTGVDTTATDLTEVGTMAQPSNFFFQAIQAFEEGKPEDAATYLQSGITALTEEGMHLEGDQKKNLDMAVTSLEAAKQKLQQGQLATVEDLKQLITAAEAYAPHKLLADVQIGEGTTEQ